MTNEKRKRGEKKVRSEEEEKRMETLLDFSFRRIAEGIATLEEIADKAELEYDSIKANSLIVGINILISLATTSSITPVASAANILVSLKEELIKIGEIQADEEDKIIH